MSADNRVYILQTKDGFRVAHLQAIEDIYWWYVCCNNPCIKEKETNSLYYEEICINCKSEKPVTIKKDKICPDRLAEKFGKCEDVWTNKESALKEAVRLYHEIMDDFGIIEYGIGFIKYDGEFPK